MKAEIFIYCDISRRSCETTLFCCCWKVTSVTFRLLVPFDSILFCLVFTCLTQGYTDFGGQRSNRSTISGEHFDTMSFIYETSRKHGSIQRLKTISLILKDINVDEAGPSGPFWSPGQRERHVCVPFPVSCVSLLRPPLYSSVSLKVILVRRNSTLASVMKQNIVVLLNAQTEKLLNIIKCLPKRAKTGVFGAVDFF